MFANWQLQMDRGKKALVMHDPASARIHFEAAVKEAESFGHNNSSLALSLESLAETILAAKESNDRNADTQKGLACYRRAASIFETVHGPMHKDLAGCLTSLAKASLVFDIVSAEKCARRAISIYAELDSADLIEPIQVLAAIFGLTGRGKEREVMLTEFVENLKNQPVSNPAALLTGLYCLAGACDSNETAIAYLEYGRRIVDDTCSIKKRVQIDILLGKLYFAEEMFLCCDTVLKEAIELGQWSPAVGSFELEEAVCRLSRLNLYYYQNYAEAKRLLDQGEEIRAKNAFLPIGANLEIEYANFAEVTGDYTKHLQLSRSALEKARQANVGSGLFVALHGHRLASALAKSGNYSEAIAVWEQALRDCISADGANSYHGVIIAASLGLEYVKIGRLNQAEELADRIMENYTPGVLADFVAPVVKLEHAVRRDSNIDLLIGAAIERIRDLEAEDVEDIFELIPSQCISLALGLAQVGRLAEAETFLKKGLTVGKTDSLFRAPSFEALASEFINAGAPELGSLLAHRATRIRETVAEREKVRGERC